MTEMAKFDLYNNNFQKQLTVRFQLPGLIETKTYIINSLIILFLSLLPYPGFA